MFDEFQIRRCKRYSTSSFISFRSFVFISNFYNFFLRPSTIFSSNSLTSKLSCFSTCLNSILLERLVFISFTHSFKCLHFTWIESPCALLNVSSQWGHFSNFLFWGGWLLISSTWPWCTTVLLNPLNWKILVCFEVASSVAT